jgi:hypothetical protein
MTSTVKMVGNEAHRAALTLDAGLREYRERGEEIGLLGSDDPRLHAIIDTAGKRPMKTELLNNLLARRNHVGLLSEDLDRHAGELWGKFPQTYSQVGLVLSAMRLSRSWEEGPWHAS